VNLSLTLIESDIRPQLSAIFARAGVRTAGAGFSGLVGDQIAARILEHNREAKAPTDFVWAGFEAGWTALADDSGHLPAQAKVWRDLAQELGRRVLALIADDDGETIGFALYQPDGSRRAVLKSDECREARGSELPIEEFFGDVPLSRDHLFLIAQTQGVDIEALNRRAKFQLWEAVI
jgi:hypothetical protein